MGNLLTTTRDIVKRTIHALQSTAPYRSWERCLHRADYPREPVRLEDGYGIQFIRQPWEHQSVRDLIAHEADRPQFELMSWLICPGDVVFDVGAHIGFFAIYASRLVAPAGNVYAFEPVPETYQRLLKTISLNRSDNVFAEPTAICDQVGHRAMNLFASTFSAWNSFGNPVMKAPDGRRLAPSTWIDVPTETLDHFAASRNVSGINFLKLDVEGFEKHALGGARRLLQERRIDFICFEISQSPLRGAGVKAREVFDFLESYGYRAWSFDGKTHGLNGPIHDSTEDWANYLATWKDPVEIQRCSR
jgi:FkbM family methyltransferase